jgi:hypothetical protein
MHHHYTGLPLEQLFELHVLVNRGVGAVDWAAERENRTRPNVVNLPRGYVRARAVAIFTGGRAQGYRYQKKTWDEFWAARWAQTPGGSVHSQYDEDMAYVPSEHAMKTKMFTVISMPHFNVNRFLSRSPQIVSWASEKYEWAKQRAIYGTDLTSYVLTDFAMPAVEEALTHIFPVGKKANEEYVQARVKLAGVGGVALCFDYADFNSQHTLQSMFEVIEGYIDVYQEEMSVEQLAAARWVLASVLKQSVHDPTGDYDTKATLLSGWRLTTLVNTMLNRIYLQYSGSLDLALDSVHNGDDALVYVPSVGAAVSFMARAAKVNIRAQPAKCTIGGIEEFLRVDRAARKPTGAQYLTRAVATAVHARAEASEPYSVYGAYSSQRTRLQELAARGADRDTVDRVWELNIKVIARSFDTQISVLKQLETTHVVHGGLSTDRDLEVRDRLVEVDYEVVASKINYARLPGVVDYANVLRRQFELPKNMLSRMTNQIGNATRKSVELVRRRLEAEAILDRDAGKVEQYLKGVCSDELYVAGHIGKARLAGLPVGQLTIKHVTHGIMARIQESRDPIRTLQIIF